MTHEEVYANIESLAKGQGFYGRIKEGLDNATTEQYNSFMEEIVSNCNDVIDMVMYLEG